MKQLYKDVERAKVHNRTFSLTYYLSSINYIPRSSRFSFINDTYCTIFYSFQDLHIGMNMSRYLLDCEIPVHSIPINADICSFDWVVSHFRYRLITLEF